MEELREEVGAIPINIWAGYDGFTIVKMGTAPTFSRFLGQTFEKNKLRRDLLFYIFLVTTTSQNDEWKETEVGQFSSECWNVGHISMTRIRAKPWTETVRMLINKTRQLRGHVQLLLEMEYYKWPATCFGWNRWCILLQ